MFPYTFKVIDISRDPGSLLSTDIIHLVEYDGTLATPEEAIDAISELDDQEQALKLGYVVAKPTERMNINKIQNIH